LRRAKEEISDACRRSKAGSRYSEADADAADEMRVYFNLAEKTIYKESAGADFR